MGRQTCFFMSEKDEVEFLQTVQEHGDRILDLTTAELTMDEVLARQLHWGHSQVYIAPQRPDAIVLHKDKLLGGLDFMNTHTSEVIELDLCERQDASIMEGRIYGDKHYVEDMQWAIKSKQFEQMYNYYHKWLRKHYKLGKDKWWYIAPDAYRKYKEEGYTMRTTGSVAEFE